MVNNSLITLLRSLNKKELTELEDFVNSPFFNKKNSVIHLFNYLKNFHPLFNDQEKLNRKNIYQALHPGKPYNYGVMKNIIYELNQLCEKYLELKNFNQNKSSQFRHLLDELTGRDLNKAFKKNLKKAEFLFSRGNRNDIYFRNKMDLELVKFNFHLKNSGRTEKPGFDLNAGKMLISYFLTKYFNINYNNLVHSLNFGNTGDIHFLDEVLNYINKTPEIDPIILLYYYKFMLLYTEDEIYYRKFRKLAREQTKNLDRKELFNTYINLLNYCYGKIISGQWSYYNELFEIYNEMLLNNIYTSAENNYFDAVHFRLAAETGIRLRKFDWSIQFIKKYSEKLNPELKQNETNIAFANYFFMRKNYYEAQNYLSLIHVKTVYDKIYIYIIQSMLYYETKQLESLISEIDAIKHFITNDKTLSVENRNSFQKYIRYVNELVKLNTHEHINRTVSINEIKKSLIPEKGVLEKQWLLEKLNELR